MAVHESLSTPNLRKLEQHLQTKCAKSLKDAKGSKAEGRGKNPEMELCCVGVRGCAACEGAVALALLDSGADVHVLPGWRCQKMLEEGYRVAPLVPAGVTLRNASGADMEVRRSVQVGFRMGTERGRAVCGLPGEADPPERQTAAGG